MFARKRLVFPLYIHLTYIRYWKFNLKKGVKYETNYYLKQYFDIQWRLSLWSLLHKTWRKRQVYVTCGFRQSL